MAVWIAFARAVAETPAILEAGIGFAFTWPAAMACASGLAAFAFGAWSDGAEICGCVQQAESPSAMADSQISFMVFAPNRYPGILPRSDECNMNRHRNSSGGRHHRVPGLRPRPDAALEDFDAGIPALDEIGRPTDGAPVVGSPSVEDDLLVLRERRQARQEGAHRDRSLEIRPAIRRVGVDADEEERLARKEPPPDLRD